jgi:hypothetical protein
MWCKPAAHDVEMKKEKKDAPHAYHTESEGREKKELIGVLVRRYDRRV